MGIISRMLRPKASLPSYAPWDDRYYVPGGSYYGGEALSSAGITVGTDSAMRLITVQNCIRVRAFTIGQLPCHVMKKQGDKKMQATDFYLYELLHDQPNSWMTSAEFWAMAEAHICLTGNFYVYKLGIEGRPIQELIPLKCGAVVEIKQDENNYTLTYYIRFPKTGEIKPIPGNKIMHLRGLTLDGIVGVNPIEYARETVGLGLASNQFLGQYFSKGMHPGAVIKHPLSLSAPAHSNLKKNLTEKYGGLGKSHELMLIDEGMDISFPSINLVDQQYLENMKMNEAQICGLFRVPLMLIQSGDKAPTYASSEQFMIAYSVYGVTPDCVNYEKAIRRDLLDPEERKKYYAKFSLAGLMRGDFKTRMEGYQIAINCELLNPNEARSLEDLNPYDGGNEFRTRTSTVKENESKNKKETKE